MRSLIAATLLLAFGCLHPRYALTQKIAAQKDRAALPDLIVVGVALINAEKGEFKVTVKNRGKGSAPSCQLHLTIIEPYRKQVLKITSTDQPAIEPQLTSALIISAQMSLPSMKYLIKTDATDKVTEANERNNVYRGEISKY